MPVYPVQLPESIRNDQKRNTEIMLYGLFKTSLPEDCSIIYSAEWICNFHGIEKDAIVDPLTGERPKAGWYPLGEIDFILIISKGLLVIEVKGGEITVGKSTRNLSPNSVSVTVWETV